ncbi:Maintenance of mitochondrial morphology protein 1 [Wickerhamiella sorbophila]|uniref:Maintenance of mitochondrial morphology protein 1 n=1 Tax=Wickerhamiella sorbophila TaxID=45607 RepID=A0A2T0FM09_9ASCO|nr:Maintenance of mitochondrial morphology protein 1 [Wickerhamiella sorbophila]PRT56024.1 Maintenance of mitochondrial morphology protein 1 [Wickerhamiella sorbophila]
MSSFAIGLLVGQMSVLVVLALLIRFFIFADSPGIKGMPSSEPPVEETITEPLAVDSILEQTYYDVDNHAAESMDWVTVLLALVISSMRQQAMAQDNLLRMLNRILASDKIPSFVDTIRVNELSLGADFPLLNNCRVYRTANSEFSNGLEAQFDVDLKDTITLGVDTRLLLNYPKTMLAYLPVSCSVSLVNFSGRVSVSLVTDEEDRNFITVSFAPNFSMEFRVNSLIGARAKLQDVPKLGQIIENTIRKRFTDKCVRPNYQKIRLPQVWHSPENAQASAATTSANIAATVSTAAATATGLNGPTLDAPSKASNTAPDLQTPQQQQRPISPMPASAPEIITDKSSSEMLGASTSVNGNIYGPASQQRIGEKFRRVASERLYN